MSCSRPRAGGVRRFIFASSGGAIYGDAAHLPADEATPARPMSPYGVTKHTFEAYLRIWQEVHGIVPVILRYANVYGPRQNALRATQASSPFLRNGSCAAGSV